jgi:hypothetical protein
MSDEHAAEATDQRQSQNHTTKQSRTRLAPMLWVPAIFALLYLAYTFLLNAGVKPQPIPESTYSQLGAQLENEGVHIVEFEHSERAGFFSRIYIKLSSNGKLSRINEKLIAREILDFISPKHDAGGKLQSGKVGFVVDKVSIQFPASMMVIENLDK